MHKVGFDVSVVLINSSNTATENTHYIGIIKPTTSNVFDGAHYSFSDTTNEIYLSFKSCMYILQGNFIRYTYTNCGTLYPSRKEPGFAPEISRKRSRSATEEVEADVTVCLLAIEDWLFPPNKRLV